MVKRNKRKLSKESHSTSSLKSVIKTSKPSDKKPSPQSSRIPIEYNNNIFSDNGGGKDTSLSSLIFGNAITAEGNDLFSSIQARKLQKVSNEKLNSNQTHLKVSTETAQQGINQNTITKHIKETRKDIIQKRKQRLSSKSSIDEIESITLVLPVFNSDEIEKEGGDDNNDYENDIVQTGIMKLFTKQADLIIRELGVLIIKQTCSDYDSNSLSHCSNALFELSLLDSMIKQSKQIENDICYELTKKGQTWQQQNDNGKDGTQQHQKQEKDCAFQYHEVASRCFGRLDIRYGMNQPPFSNDAVIGNKVILPIVNSLLGKCAKLVYAGLILSFPHSANQPWHQDGTALFDEDDGFTSDMHLPPYALNVFVPLDDIDEEIGPTEFVLGSHYGDVAKDIIQPQNHSLSTNIADKSTIGPLLHRGDVLIYDYRVCHRGTCNVSKCKTRPMLYLMYARPWFYEHLNFGKESLFEK